AFTAVDRKAIKQAAENYPDTPFYKTDELLTQLGIGEALITMLNEKGIPTPLVHTMLRPPQSRMDILNDAEVSAIVQKSKLVQKYNQAVDSVSAYELLTQKIEQAQQRTEEIKQMQEQAKATAKQTKTARQPKEQSWLDNPMVKSAGRTAATMLTRSLLGVLGLGGSTRRRSKGFF
ncbi:MAG: DUF853 family protein, partial [Flavisolibacter sp.]|nr:DUF853 family protein [Flavisolibacter sp.]